MARAACKDCGVLPKHGNRHRCVVCYLRHQPIGDQVQAARVRLAMVPEPLRRPRVPAKDWPEGHRWCSGCQTFVQLADVPRGGTRCRPCASAVNHSAMVQKVYGITGDDYAGLLARQGGRCAICRGRPTSIRLAVDHDHKTGAVRGLLCSRCNHDLMGAAWDSGAIALALWHYINTPPTSGHWIPPEDGLAAPGDGVAVEAPPAPEPPSEHYVNPGAAKPARGKQAADLPPEPPALPAEWRAKPQDFLNRAYRELLDLLNEISPPPF